MTTTRRLRWMAAAAVAAVGLAALPARLTPPTSPWRHPRRTGLLLRPRAALLREHRVYEEPVVYEEPAYYQPGGLRATLLPAHRVYHRERVYYRHHHHDWTIEK